MNSIVIAMSHDSSGVFASDTVSIPPGGSSAFSAVWVSTRPGTDSIRVYIDGSSLVLQSQYDNDSVQVVTQPGTVDVAAPEARARVWLAPAFPNPARALATFRFTLPIAGHATLRIYDVAGRRVASVVDEWLQPGFHVRYWDTRQVAAGVYFYSLRSGSSNMSRQIIIVR
jgi:hypothetical protein